MPASTTRLPLRTASVALLAALCACGNRRERRAEEAQRDQVDSLAQVAVRLATRDSSPVGRATIPNRIGMPQIAGVAPDSLRIVSTDGAVVYTLVRDTVRMQLGDSVVRAVRQKVNAGADSASGNFGGFLARTVAGAVGSAMSFVMKTPVRDIRTARYEDGELRIETSGGVLHHSTVNVGDKHGNDHTRFAPADGERFVAAIEARQRALGVK
ncbi:hypothetical protein tb265_12250 [Gemmatimonadetes bacterium T265]|nr:hypothetical protein tb265_12250 [Gemmatimonadetes bacterium T265]